MIYDWKKRLGFSILGCIIFGMFVLPSFVLAPLNLLHGVILGLATLLAIPACLNARFHLNQRYFATYDPETYKRAQLRERSIAICLVIVVAIAAQFLDQNIMGMLVVTVMTAVFMMAMYAVTYYWRNRPRT
jgi:hypothetical protein